MIGVGEQKCVLGSQGNWNFFSLQALEEVQGFKQDCGCVEVLKRRTGTKCKDYLGG